MKYNFDEHATEYETMLGEAHKYYIKTKVTFLQKQLKRIGDPAIILDVACGTGQAEALLNSRIVGLDVARKMLQIARSRAARSDFIRAEVLELPFADDTFDAAFSFALMHHLDRDLRRRALMELARVIRPGKYLMTFEHNPYNPITRYLVDACVLDQGVELIHPHDLANIHREVGLAILNVNYIIFFPKALSHLSFLERLLHRIPLGGQYEILARKM